MYSNLINKLKEKNINLKNGLDNNELSKVESVYNVKFPIDLKEFYAEVLPVGEGFYNWRDFSKINVNNIKRVLDRPFQNVKEDISNIVWNENWGNSPEDSKEISKCIMRLLEKAPKLIPIYKHRYMASQYNSSNPIFSIYGLDIIYYGENLEQYFDLELRYKKHSDINYNNIRKIDFWSDIL